MRHLIGMTSVTYAVRAEKYLRSQGVRVKIVPTPKTVGSGCGYSLELPENADLDRTLGMLRDAHIKIKEVYK